MEKRQKKIGFKGKGECEEGITLLVLVISIIVLLILAGISISMLTGQNSILNRAGEAKEKTEIASMKEEIELAYAEANMYGDNVLEVSKRILDKTNKYDTSLLGKTLVIINKKINMFLSY